MNKKTPLYSGMLGGGIVIALFITVLLSANLFNYRIRIDKVNINAIQLSDTLKIKNNTDSIYQSRVEFKQTLVEDLKNDKSILTPQEYTNNIVNYYNSILLILSVMLAAFSVLSFVYIKSQTNDWIQEKLDSDEFKEEVSEILVGKAENRFRETLSDLQDKIRTMENEIAELNERCESNNLDEEIE